VLLLRTHRYGAFWHNSHNATVISVSYSLSDRYNSTSRGPWTFLVFFLNRTTGKMRYTTSRLARPSELKSKLHCVPPTVNIPYQFFQVDKTACCRASNPFTMNSVLIKFENPTAILTRDMNASCSPTILVTYADGYATCNSQHVTRGSRVRSESWAAQPGVWGDNVPPLLGPAGYRGVQRGGPIKMIFASTADSLYSVLYK